MQSLYKTGNQNELKCSYLEGQEHANSHTCSSSSWLGCRNVAINEFTSFKMLLHYEKNNYLSSWRLRTIKGAMYNSEAHSEMPDGFLCDSRLWRHPLPIAV